MSEVLKLTEELVRYRTDQPSEIENAMGFARGWLEAHDIRVEMHENNNLPILIATVGSGKPSIIFHAHLDIVPGKSEQFNPTIFEGKLYGRGTYDMKGALAAMMCSLTALRNSLEGHKVRLVIVPDEEKETGKRKASEYLVEKGISGDFVICGEPTDLDIGIQAKGVLALEITVFGKSAHGSTPWKGENAIVKAVNLYRRIISLSFARERSTVFDGPSINLGQISGGDVINKVPEECKITLDIRYLPVQSPHDILSQIRTACGDETKIEVLFQRPPAILEPENPFVQVLLSVIKDESETVALSVGRDGTSDVTYFLERGIPGVEFGPKGANHHADDEYIEIDSLEAYERILTKFALNPYNISVEIKRGISWAILSKLKKLFRTGRPSFSSIKFWK